MDKHLFKEDGTGIISNREIDEKVTKCLEDVIDTYETEYNLAELELYVMELVMETFLHKRITNKSDKIRKGIAE